MKRIKRAKLPAMKRNAAVVLGNVGTAEDIAVLTRALDDPEPLVREHAAWALRQLDGERAAPGPGMEVAQNPSAGLT